jgi:hypothetical protein
LEQLLILSAQTFALGWIGVPTAIRRGYL